MLARKWVQGGVAAAGILCAGALWATGQRVAAGEAQAGPAKGTEVAEGGALIFQDGFEYEVKRDEEIKQPAFVTEGKWSRVKSVNSGGRGANGYLYTVDRIPGYAGAFPGRDSKRVLALEGRAGTFKGQTDFYLQYGTGDGPADQIPGNVWFQFWMYVNNYDDPQDKEDQISGFRGGMKWIYPSVDGNYPTHPGWLLVLGTSKQVVLEDREKAFYAEVPSSDLLVCLISENGAEIKKAEPWDHWKLGQTSLDEHIVANRWTFVRLHMDTSTTSGRFEVWLRPLGGKEVKVVEWIDGVTPDFSWKIPAEKLGGYRVFRIPTTMGSFGERAHESDDCWIYLDDFAMARSEDALPEYSD